MNTCAAGASCRPSWSFPGFDSPEGFKVSFLNYYIMITVVKSLNSYVEILRDLRGCGSIALPVSVVPDFVKFCNRLGVYPCGYFGTIAARKDTAKQAILINA